MKGEMMKVLAAFPLTLAALALPQAAHAQSALGANYNESLTTIDEGELKRADADWLRGFLDMHLMGDVDPAKDPNVRAILAAKARGHHVILSLKWNYHQMAFPAPGSGEMKAELARLNRLLPVVLGKVDVLVIGNEPFIETKPDEPEEKLNVFYETMAGAVIDAWKAKGGASSSTRLFMGAFNRLDLPRKRTPGVDRMLHFIASRPDLSGADLHPHLPSLAANREMIDYVLAKLRPDQKFLATEFSVVWLWKAHLNDVASAGFAKQYGFPTGTRVYEVINAATQKPMPYEEWKAFLSGEPWYMAQQNFLSDAMTLYRSTGRLAVATYGIRQNWGGRRPFTATTDPWILNSVFAAKTVQRNPDGSAHENFPWGEGFRKAMTAGE
jgi:hypothetical protein